MQIREIMTSNPACCTPDTTLREIAQMMVEHDCGLVPVVDNQTNKIAVGTITDRDITIRAFATGGNPAEMKASDVMTMGVTTVSPETSVQECADIMEDKKIRRVLVADTSGRCVGIVAQADIAGYGRNPELIGDLVQEISEAESSPNRGAYNRMRNNRSFSGNQSFERNQSFDRNQSFERNRSFDRDQSFERDQFYDRDRSIRGYVSPSRRPQRSVSADQSFSRKRKYETEESGFGFGTLLPLLAGIGIAVGAKYYFDSDKEQKRIAIERLRSRQPVKISGETITTESRGDLPHRTEVHSFEDKNSTSSSVYLSHRDTDTTDDAEIGRTASQS